MMTGKRKVRRKWDSGELWFYISKIPYLYMQHSLMQCIYAWEVYMKRSIKLPYDLKYDDDFSFWKILPNKREEKKIWVIVKA